MQNCRSAGAGGRERHQKGQLDPGGVIGVRGGFPAHPLGELRRFVLNEFAVERRERLKRRGGGGAAGAVQRHDREIKNVEQAG